MHELAIYLKSEKARDRVGCECLRMRNENQSQGSYVASEKLDQENKQA